jgi:ATP-dependent helicase/nuclease subunit B
VTALDRLRADPYQFYAQAILGLRALDPLDAEPARLARHGGACHSGCLAQDGAPQGALVATAGEVLDTMSAHPLARSLWRPRLLAALEWIDAKWPR